jgi:uncharacterized phage protein (TIGR01671 family)
MNREIKFRAWDAEDDLISHPFSLGSKFVSFPYPPPFRGDQKVSLEDVGCESEQYAVMQFTGLKDRNGVEIYEGDILGTKGEKTLPGGARVIGSYSFEHGTRDTVEWDRDCWRVGTKDLAEWLWGAERYSNGEVVGNIYANREFLTKESDDPPHDGKTSKG